MEHVYMIELGDTVIEDAYVTASPQAALDWLKEHVTEPCVLVEAITENDELESLTVARNGDLGTVLGRVNRVKFGVRDHKPPSPELEVALHEGLPGIARMLGCKHVLHRNEYHCIGCDEMWHNEEHYSSTDRCPKCGVEMEPCFSVEMVK